jgi:hypothetical protein
MAPTFFRNIGGKLEKIEMPEMNQYKGWYRTVTSEDLDGNGLPDLILGNQGLNSRFKAKNGSSVRMYLNDFDQNGSIEQIFTTTENDVQIPFTLKHELEKQIPGIRKKYIRYSNYNNQSLDQIFDPAIISKSVINEVNHLESGVMMNQGNGKFEWISFPRMAQRSWIFALSAGDFDEDGKIDLILGGNLNGVKPEIGKSDASYGEVLLGNGDGSFTFSPNSQNHLKLDGEIRAISPLGNSEILFVKNNDQAEIWKYEKK